MTRLIPFFTCLIIFFNSQSICAQNFSLIWANRIGSPLYDDGLSIAVDASGSSYVTGTLNGNAIILKYDPMGNMIWNVILVDSVSGTKGLHIEVDVSANVYVCGYFTRSTDFDPGLGSYVLTPSHPEEIFLLKLDSSGSFIWARQLGGGVIGINNAAVSLDASGNTYVAGAFESTADFDPGPGVFSMTSTGMSDIFITKLDPSGNFVWSKAMGGSGMDYCHAIKNDSNGNILIAGSFCATVDFDPGPGVNNLTAAAGDGMEIYIAKYDPSGNFIWARQMYGPSGPDGVRGLAVDGTGNVYTTGFFTGTVDFDPGAAVQNLTAVGTQDIFICKLDYNGNFSWARGMGTSAQDNGWGISVDANANVFYAGSFSGAGDFDPGPAACFFSCAGATDCIISEFDANGNFKWATQIGGTGWDEGFGIVTDGAGNIYATGFFADNVDFDPCSTIYNLFGGVYTDMFIVKYGPNPNAPSVSISTPTSTICPGSSATFTASPVNTGSVISYQWQVNNINAGTNSPAFTSSNLQNGDMVHVIMTCTNACSGNSIVNSDTISIQIVPPSPASVTISTANTTVCAGAATTFLANAVNGGSSPTYQWQLNSTNVGTNSSMYSTNSLSSGDVVMVIMTSSSNCVTGSPATSNPVTVTVSPGIPASVNITASANNICPGTNVAFIATATNGGASPAYQWQVNGTNIGSNSPSYNTGTLNNGDVVNCILTSSLNCATPSNISSNNIIIVIDPTKCVKGFWAPTAFTPNHDGKNDLFRPLVFGNLVMYKFTIFNRWGEKVFETSDPQKGWDGKIKGRQQDSQVFVWVATYQISGEAKQEKKGSFMLIR